MITENRRLTHKDGKGTVGSGCTNWRRNGSAHVQRSQITLPREKTGKAMKSVSWHPFFVFMLVKKPNGACRYKL